MDWKELRKKIITELYLYKKDNKKDPNVIVLGQVEREVLNKADEIGDAIELFTGKQPPFERFGVFDDNFNVKNIFGADVCVIDVESIIKVGYIA